MNLVSEYYQTDESLRKLIRELSYNPDAFTLDVGCKKGDTSVTIRKNVRGMVGIDLEFHDEWYSLQNEIHFVNGNASMLPFADGSFDMVIAGECLQYIPNPEWVIDEIYRVLKKDGMLVMSFPESGPLATYLDPYNLGLIPKLLYRPSAFKKYFVKHLSSKKLMHYCGSKWQCQNFYRRGSIFFIYIACLIDTFQSIRKRLISRRGPGKTLGEVIMKPVIKLFFILMKADFSMSWGSWSYNNIICLRKSIN